MGSAYPAARLWGHFLKIKSLVFSKFWHVTETQMKLCLREPDFLKKKTFLLPKLGKYVKNGQETGFFEFIEEIFLIY